MAASAGSASEIACQETTSPKEKKRKTDIMSPAAGMPQPMPPNEVDEENIVVSVCLPKGSCHKMLLSPFDVFEARFDCRRQYAYSPEAAPLIGKVQSSLHRLLERHPWLGGSLVADGRDVFVEYSRPKIYLVRRKSDRQADLGAWAENRFDSDLVCGRPACDPLENDYPLFIAKYIELADKWVLLSVAISHGLADAQSFSDIISEWVALTRQDAQLGETHPERSKLVIRDVEESAFDVALVHAQGWRDHLGKALVAHSLSPSDPTCVRCLNFERKDIELLKCCVRKGSAWEKFEKLGWHLSANDVVTAAVWQTLAAVRYAEKPNQINEEFPLMTVLNWRRFTDRVSNQFMGNATTHPVCSRFLRQVLNADFSELAFWVRESLMQYSAEDCEHLIRYMNFKQYRSADGPRSLLSLGTPFIPGMGLFISNSSKYDFYNADFGNGRPALVCTPNSVYPNRSFVKPDSSGEGIVASIMMYTTESSRLVFFDCEGGQPVLQ